MATDPKTLTQKPLYQGPLNDRYRTSLSGMDMSKFELTNVPKKSALHVASLIELWVILTVVWVTAKSITLYFNSHSIQDVIESAVMIIAIAVGVFYAQQHLFPGGRSLRDLINKNSATYAWREQSLEAYLEVAEQVMEASRRVSFLHALQALSPYDTGLKRFRYLRFAALQKQGKLWEFMWTNGDQVYAAAPRVIELAQFIQDLHRAEQIRDKRMAQGDGEIF